MSRSSGPSRGGPGHRRPQRLEGYLAVQDAHIARFRDYFLVESDLVIARAEGEVTIAGRLRFVDDLILDVRIVLTVDDDGRVRVDAYGFNAALVHDRHRPIFRYDNAHPYPGHPDAHHKHVFDPRQPDALGTVAWVGAERAPSLGEAIDELFRWWHEAGRSLDLPER